MTSSEIIEVIRQGGAPTICGRSFTEEQIKEIREILVRRKQLINSYFNSTIMTRMEIRSKDWDELIMK